MVEVRQILLIMRRIKIVKHPTDNGSGQYLWNVDVRYFLNGDVLHQPQE